MEDPRLELPQEVQTSLEIPLTREGDGYRIDLQHLPVFFGLSVLAADIADKIVNRYYLDRVDVEVEKKVKHTETPELAELQIENIKAQADYEVLDRILGDKEAFSKDLIAAFGSLQMQRWRKHIYPPGAGTPSRALVFPACRRLGDRDYPFRVVLERLRSSKKHDKFFLRTVIEGLDHRHLDLSSFPHVVVLNPEGRTFIAGSTRLSQMLFEQVRWEARRGKRTYSEVNRLDSFVFSRLHEAGLTELAAIEISWADRYLELIRTMEPRLLTGVFKKILLLLEDHPVRDLLHSGRTIRVDLGEIHANLDFSQLGRTLNISFGHRRKTLNIEQYLERLPTLRQTSAERSGELPLQGTKILLIHHVTAEILAFLAALRALGAEQVFTLFIHYGEDVPSDFLEALLQLDQRRFRCYSLNRVEEPLSVEGYFVLSPRYSPLLGLERLNEQLYRDKPRFLGAMVRTATRLFLELLLETAREGQRCLVLEDGGYLGPGLAEWPRKYRRFSDLYREEGLPVPSDLQPGFDLPPEEFLDRWLVGTVEHTKNGLDRLAQALSREGSLARPAFSIAISDLKVTEEAREVATSILAAMESVLHALGKALSRRRALVLGSRGAIGRHLVEQLETRLLPAGARPCLEVDLRPPPDLPGAANPSFATRFRELPRATALGVDLIIGVTGRPALLWEDLETLLLEGRRASLYLVSGSSKTVEFEAVSQGLDRLLRSGNPTLGDTPCRIEAGEIPDPQTRRLLGTRFRFFLRQPPCSPAQAVVVKDVCFLGSLMPINFLYYGVPGEVFDPVLSQLLRCGLGLVRRSREPVPPAKALFAVDHQIDVDGRPLTGTAPGLPGPPRPPSSRD